MKVIESLRDVAIPGRPIITVGAFDGIHRGHQALMHRLVDRAQDAGQPSVAITFDPHPRIALSATPPPRFLLTTKEEKIRRLQSTGIDYLVVVPFTAAFAQQSPEEYIENFLIRNFHPSKIIVGYDHRYGAGRRGDISLLKTYAESGAFDVEEFPPYRMDNTVVSSTNIRQALLRGDVHTANALLGYPYTMEGTVVEGMRLGRRLGFPTANIDISHPYKLIPADGIYAVRASVEGQEYTGMLYIGVRPTLNDAHQRVIEIHLFNFEGDLYQKTIRIEFHHFIRADEKFDSLDQLKRAIARDRDRVMHYFQQHPPSRKNTSVAVAILNYNGLQHLKTFLPTVCAQLGHYRIAVIDNGSTDSSLDYLRKHHPEVEIVQLDKNYGFAEGYNLGLKHIDAEYYFLLNSDVYIDSDILNPLLQYLQRHPDVAAVQPKVRSYRQKTHFEYAGACGGWIDLLGYPFCRGRLLDTVEEDRGQYDDPIEIFWATGAAMLIRAELFHKIGGFDPWFFAHQEEIDLCWRLKRAGYAICVEPSTTIYHLGGGTLNYTNPTKTLFNFRNSLASLIKNTSLAGLLWKAPLRIALDYIALLFFAAKGEFSHARAVLTAHAHIVHHLRKLWKKRQQSRKNIHALRIGPDRSHIGRYHRLLIIDYFIRKRKHFSQLGIRTTPCPTKRPSAS